MSFFVDKERDKKALFNWNWDWDPAGLESRAAEKGISLAFAHRLRGASSYDEVRKELDEFVDGLHDNKAEQLESFIRDLQDFWTKSEFTERLLHHQAVLRCRQFETL